MSYGYIGEIRMFAGSRAPEGWAICNGARLPIREYQVLYSVVRTTYGGDGVNDFALPDFRGRVPVCQGQAPGLSNRVLGQSYGSEGVALAQENTPNHTHLVQGTSVSATSNKLNGNLLAVTSFGLYADGLTPSGVIKNFSPSAVAFTGNGHLHSNMMPTMSLNFIIAFYGEYPMAK